MHEASTRAHTEEGEIPGEEPAPASPKTMMHRFGLEYFKWASSPRGRLASNLAAFKPL
jgi:hypothetical protein